MIGYVMVIYDYDIPEYDIWHMMIYESNQEQGYGSIALDLTIEYIKTKPFGTSNKVTLRKVRQHIRHLAVFMQRRLTKNWQRKNPVMYSLNMSLTKAAFYEKNNYAFSKSSK